MMKAQHFKKADQLVHTTAEDGAVENDTELSSSVIRPPVSVFHKLPEIAPIDGRGAAAISMTGGNQVSDFEKGVRDGEAKTAQLYQDTIQLMEATLETLRAQYSVIQSEIEASHLNAVAQCLKSILPGIAERSAEAEILELIRSLSAPAMEGVVTLRVHPDEVAKIEALIGQRNGSNDTFKVIPDDNTALSVLSAKWQGGGVKVDTSAAAQMSLDALDRALSDVSGG